MKSSTLAAAVEYNIDDGSIISFHIPSEEVQSYHRENMSYEVKFKSLMKRLVQPTHRENPELRGTTFCDQPNSLNDVISRIESRIGYHQLDDDDSDDDGMDDDDDDDDDDEDEEDADANDNKNSDEKGAEDAAEDINGLNKPTILGKAKKKRFIDDYDHEDRWIDDSERIEEVNQVRKMKKSKTKHGGFFVSSGALEVLPPAPPKKKVKKTTVQAKQQPMQTVGAAIVTNSTTTGVSGDSNSTIAETTTTHTELLSSATNQKMNTIAPVPALKSAAPKVKKKVTPKVPLGVAATGTGTGTGSLPTAALLAMSKDKAGQQGQGNEQAASQSSDMPPPKKKRKKKATVIADATVDAATTTTTATTEVAATGAPPLQHQPPTDDDSEHAVIFASFPSGVASTKMDVAGVATIHAAGICMQGGSVEGKEVKKARAPRYISNPLYLHTFTPSYPHTFIPLYLHTFIPSYPQYTLHITHTLTLHIRSTTHPILV